MIPAGKLKENLQFNKSLGDIIDTLKLTASIQLRQFQTKRPLYENFLEEVKECADILELEKISHPLVVLHRDLPRCIVGITSDEGFLGELNTLVVNGVLAGRNEKEGDVVVILGERGASYLEDINVSFVAFPGITDELRPARVENLKGYLIGEYLKGRFSEVEIIYPRFLSVTAQRVEAVKLLPFSLTRDAEGAGRQKREQPPDYIPTELLIEPGSADVAEGLVKLWLGYVLGDIFWSSKLSELAARLMHLDGSEQELNQVNRRLNLAYFKHLHMLADKTIREISAARFLRRH
ncbi:MAG: hypothetical protein DRP85_07170 [Candidatus Makaraimicrobium thalassicum]|nr:MAG: hypothetical protein DRP85_07170 [Candidatus Omnitrophota bacterium]